MLVIVRAAMLVYVFRVDVLADVFRTTALVDFSC